MNIYMAPLEGITGWIYRNAYEKVVGNIDKYYSPFISTKSTGKYKDGELRDILPENNTHGRLVPQILSNNADDFNELAKKISDLGYREINLNLGCPSPTVTTKKKGAGMLEDTEMLNRFLCKIYENADGYDISIKTRIGISEPEEFRYILSVFNRYPVKELTVHPRLLESKYMGKPNLDWYSYAYNNSINPVCYNSDINSVKDFKAITSMFANTKSVMIGRGLLMDPLLTEKIVKSDYLLSANEEVLTMKKLHDEIYEAYKDYMSGDKNVLFKMKEIWSYLIQNESFSFDKSKVSKLIKKSNSCKEYDDVIYGIVFQEVQ